jgi:A/G-specific adenine glycosylase
VTGAAGAKMAKSSRPFWGRPARLPLVKSPRPQPETAADQALRRDLITWYLANRRDLPWRRTRDPFAIWLSEVMLQQTRVEAVLGYWERFLDALPTVQDLAAADEDLVVALWSGLGYYRRARALHAASKTIVQDFGGQLPRDQAALQALPGFGPYTTGAVRSIAFGESAPLVDGNVARVFSRLFALEYEPGSGPANRALWAVATRLVPRALTPAARAKDQRSAASRDAAGAMSRDRGPGTWNQALMELGATLCAPTRSTKSASSGPRCGECPVQGHCQAFAAGRTAELPLLKKPTPPVLVTLEVLVVETPDGLLMQRRPADGRMASMWEFPTREVAADEGPTHLWPALLDSAEVGALWARAEPRPSQKHSITRHRITCHVRYFAAKTTDIGPNPPYDAVPRGHLMGNSGSAPLPLTGLSAKILAVLD